MSIGLSSKDQITVFLQALREKQPLYRSLRSVMFYFEFGLTDFTIWDEVGE
jgi:hypothetical protein